MLYDKIISILKEAQLYDADKLWHKEDWELEMLPGIGPATVKKIRKTFGPSIFSMSAKKQAEFLGVPYEEIAAYRTKKGWSLDNQTWIETPEPLAKYYYKKQGFNCDCGENYTIWLLMEALMYPLLLKNDVPLYFSYKDTITETWGKYISVTTPALSVFNSKIIDLTRNNPNVVVNTIATTNETQLRKGLRAIFRHDEHENEPLEDEHLVKIWKQLGSDRIHFLAQCYVNNIGYIGWPDLTLIKNGKLFFVEVKASDKLHSSQVDWWLNVAKPAGLNFQITRIIKKK